MSNKFIDIRYRCNTDYYIKIIRVEDIKEVWPSYDDPDECYVKTIRQDDLCDTYRLATSYELFKERLFGLENEPVAPY